MGHFPRAKCPKLQPRLHLIQPWGAGRGHRGRHVTRTWHHIGRLFGPMSKFMPGGWTIGALTCFNYHKYQEYQDVELWTIEKTWSWIFWQIENSVEVELMVRLSCLTINMWCSRNGLTKSSRFSAANYALEMGDTRIPPMARYHWSLFWDKHIQRLVASTNPSEKWWSSSAGMMTFPIIMYICIYIYIWKNNPNVPVTTNQIRKYSFLRSKSTWKTSSQNTTSSWVRQQNFCSCQESFQRVYPSFESLPSGND